MKLSKKGEYALRALICLCSPGIAQVLSIQEIAKRAQVPKKFLEQVLLALKKGGIVQSNRGKAGGYALRGVPAGVTLGDIIRAVDGPLAPLPCATTVQPAKCADCSDLEHCWLRMMMMEVGEAISTVLSQMTLAEICRRAAQGQRRGARALMYEI
jgi:Rrf2 family protein